MQSDPLLVAPRKTGAVAIAAALAATLVPATASAQLDVNPPLPNVLLLVDTSGSMERMIDGTLPESGAGACTPGVPMPKSSWNRWATLVQVLTGDIDNFSCYALDRSTDPFKDEFAWSGVKPYDYRYHLPFHRLVSNDCVAGPGQMLSTWFDWPAGAIAYHQYNDKDVPCATGFKQASPGLLDTFQNEIRFGLLTLDSWPEPGTGAIGTQSDATSGMKGPNSTGGLWSYYPGWDTGGAHATANMPNCATPIDYEVGARNAAAPAWEGRLISPGHFDASLSEMQQTNAQVQEALIAARPYGRTSLGAFMQDAETFLLSDPFPDPSNPGEYLGPNQDPYFTGGCRPSYIILLSDGEPESELRPACTSVNGCPFRTPDVIASELAALSPNPVLTYVVGFGVSSQGSVSCAGLGAADFAPGGVCENPAAGLTACCYLAQIAVSGGTTNAYFADDVTGLAQALSSVLSQISATSSTSRTIPAFAANANAASTTRAFQFVSSFNAPISGQLWNGNLERKRYVCNGGAAQIAAVDPALGDRFMDNVNMNDSSHPRQFFTAVGGLAGALIHSGRSVRPYAATDDGLGLYASAPSTDDTLRDGPAFALYVPPSALDIDASEATTCTSLFGSPVPSECSERLLRWQVGETNTTFGLSATRDVTACPVGSVCSEFGAIYHSTPSTVGPPREFLNDASYGEFAAQTTGAGLRPVMLYTATTDGQLHAFKVSATDPNDTFTALTKANNELWSFIPPAVLPRFLPTYNQRVNLLDGVTVVKDVVFERTRTQALAGKAANGGASWSTVLLAGGGEAGGFYYALDVTDPTEPKFLWQLSEDTLGNPLFGSTSATPAIATVNVLDNGVLTEVAVAILPGGSAPVLAGSCARTTPAAKLNGVDVNGVYVPRSSVRCWGAASSISPGPARSLTIARLDTGEILMNFRNASTDGPPLVSTKMTTADFDSPLTGVPVPYPAETGKVATRVFVGDADGTLWRINIVDPNPANWTADLAWDAYPSPAAYDVGQPIATPPVVSIDPGGSNVILFSTGDQQLFTSSGSIETVVWSITEKTTATALAAAANWQIPFTNGKRVTGPISLFDSVAYFATYTPTPITPGVASCADGFADIWGVHYTETGALDPSDPCPPDAIAAAPYPRQAFVDTTNPGVLTYCNPTPLVGSVVFGVAITQTPSCATTSSVSDPYFGSHTSITSATGSSFQLVVQTGSGGTTADGSVTNTTTIPLPSPTRTTKIDSWACILE